jgi:diaminopimelate epimerase
MKLKFTKMHGAGNDFVVIDGVSQHIDFTAQQWAHLGDRRFGVGADQMLLIQASSTPGVDFRYRIFNADGGEVEQCGNGSRAFVKFVLDKGLTGKRTIKVETMNGVIAPSMLDDGSISVDMGAPVLEAALVPFNADGLTALEDGRWTIDVNGRSVPVAVVSMGNPHAVQLVADIDSAPVAIDGPVIEHHPRFPKRVNAGFMQIVDRQRIKLRVFERGAGETLACGTGACAAVVAGIRLGLLDSPVSVAMRGGDLTIVWAGADASVVLSGPAVTVFEGEIEI